MRGAVVTQIHSLTHSLTHSISLSSNLHFDFFRFDTLRGIRGEIQCQIKIQFFGDINPFKESSAGVQYFSMSCVPPGLQIQAFLGFLEVLHTEDDPEYHWTDNFRTPRTSNEARTRCMFRLSGQIRRQLGRKVRNEKLHHDTT